MTIGFRFTKTLVSKITTSQNYMCQILFGSKSSLFGENPICNFLNDTIVINLNTGNSINGGETFQIANGVLGANYCNETFEGSLTTPIIPSQLVTGNIDIPNFVSYCTAFNIIIFNIGGDLNRPYKLIEVTADILSGGVTDSIRRDNNIKLNWILSQMQTINSTSYLITIPPNSLLPNALYSFKLTVINFQGIVRTDEVQIATTSAPLLDIQLEGIDSTGNLTVEISEEIIIRPIISYSQCGILYPNITALVISYVLLNNQNLLNTTQLIIDAKTDRILWIKPYTLTADFNYYFQVFVNSSTTNLTLGSISFTIFAKQPALQVKISPLFQSLATDKSLVIKGSKSYDRNLTYIKFDSC